MVPQDQEEKRRQQDVQPGQGTDSRSPFGQGPGRCVSRGEGGLIGQAGLRGVFIHDWTIQVSELILTICDCLNNLEYNNAVNSLLR